MTRLVVAGLGAIGSRHAQAVLAHPAAELAGVVDPDPAFRGGYGVPGFASLDKIGLDADGVILATPSALHPDHAEYCLSRGWACLVEKPAAVDLAGADRIILAASRTGLPVLVGHHRRQHRSVQTLRKMLNDGVIGRPVLASAIWAVRKPAGYFDSAWRRGPDGAPVRMNMVHEIDLLRFLLGEIADVRALGAEPVRKAGRVESGALVFQFESDAIATVAFADTAPTPWSFEAGTSENPEIAASGEDSLRIMGTEGAIAFPSLTHWSGARDWSETLTRKRHEAKPTNPIEAQVGHFCDVIAGRAAPLTGAVDARATLDALMRVETEMNASKVFT